MPYFIRKFAAFIAAFIHYFSIVDMLRQMNSKQ